MPHEDNGPRGPGGAPSFPGGSAPGPAPDDDDDDPDPSPGPSTPGGSPSFPGGSDPEPPDDDPGPSPGPRGPGGSPSVPGGTDPEPPERTTISVGGQTANIPDVGVGSGPTPGEFGEINETSLRAAGESYSENVADPIGAAVRRSSPATELDRVLPGEPVGRSVQGVTEGVVSLGNVPAAAAGGIAAFDRAARDTRRANQEGAEGRRQNRQELASDAVDAATSTGRAIQRDPIGTLSRLGGAAVGGAFVGGAASRALRGTPDAPDAPDTPDGTVPSGRSNVGTGGRGSVLEDVDVDAERGISGPSTRSRVDRIVSDSPLGDFLDDARGQAQIGRQRSRDEPDFGDAPDRTRPADAGGTFEDVRQDALTQLQDDLGDRGRRPDFGDYEGAPSPFGRGSGDTIDPDAGVQLERGTGSPGTVGAVDDVTPSSTGATGLGAGLGGLAGVNDPTGIADTDTVTGSRSGERTRGGTGGLAGGDVRLGTIADSTDPTGISPTDDTDTGTGIGSDVGTDTGAGTDTDTIADTGAGGGSDSGTRTEPIPQLRAETAVGTRSAPGAVTDTPTGTGTVAEADTASDVGADGFATRTGFGFGGSGTPPRLREEEEGEQDDDEPLPFGLAARGDEIDSGISSAEDQLEELGFDTDGLGSGDPFSL